MGGWSGDLAGGAEGPLKTLREVRPRAVSSQHPPRMIQSWNTNGAPPCSTAKVNSHSYPLQLLSIYSHSVYLVRRRVLESPEHNSFLDSNHCPLMRHLDYRYIFSESVYNNEHIVSREYICACVCTGPVPDVRSVDGVVRVSRRRVVSAQESDSMQLNTDSEAQPSQDNE